MGLSKSVKRQLDALACTASAGEGWARGTGAAWGWRLGTACSRAFRPRDQVLKAKKLGCYDTKFGFSVRNMTNKNQICCDFTYK